jgi:glycosyltransferase involved in cell wall biosynthesis
MKISICIPTYNRAEKLRETLLYLSSFSDTGFEIIIGNNDSKDHTDEVVRHFELIFSSLIYVKHSENLGFSRNIDSVLMRASREYIYVLSDDDIVYEDALKLAIGLLERDSDLMGVVGEYQSLRMIIPNLRVDYSDAVVTTVPKGAFAALFDNLSICDGHPVMRRNTFHRYCSYHDRSVGLLPLYFKLLTLGKVYAVNKPFFQHRTSSESLTARMAEPWFLDMWFADMEVAAGLPGVNLEPSVLERARQRMMRTLYLQAARMSQNSNSYYEMWFFLRRLIGIQGAEDIALHAESNFCHEFVLERLRRVLMDGQYQTVRVAPHTLAAALAAKLDVRVEDIGAEAQALPAAQRVDLLLCDEASSAMRESGQGAGTVLAIAEIVDQIRLSKAPAKPVFRDGRLCLDYLNDADRAAVAQSSFGYQVLMAPYSELDAAT